MSATPLVSVIMPVYNAGAYLRPAVDGVLRQTYQNWELILIDDGSTDGCVAALDDINDPRVKKIRQANAGKPVVMNRALAMARGEFYALNDADDISHPERLAKQVAALQANPQAAGVFVGHEILLGDRVLAPTFRAKNSDECAKDIAGGRMPGHDPTAMYRLSLVGDMRYAEDLPVVEGFDYILRVGERFPLLVVGECLYGYRIHPESVTKKDPARRNRLVQQVYDRMYDRRGLPRRPAPGLSGAPRDSRRDADNDLVSHFTISVADQVLAGQKLGALRTGWSIWRMHPTSTYYAKPLIYAMMPRVLMKMYRDAKTRRAERREAMDAQQAPAQAGDAP